MKKDDDKTPRAEAGPLPFDVQAWLEALPEAERADMERIWHLAGLARGTRPKAEAVEAACTRFWAAVDEGDTAPRRRTDRPAPRRAETRWMRQVALSVLAVVLVGGGLLVFLLQGGIFSGDPTGEGAEFIILLRGGDLEGGSPEEREQIVEALAAWASALQRAHRFRAGDELADGGHVLSKEGRQVVDRPFALSQGDVGGYFIIVAKDYEDALELARGCPYLDVGGTVELRQIIKH